MGPEMVPSFFCYKKAKNECTQAALLHLVKGVVLGCDT